MELWDVYDRYKRKTGRLHQRGMAMTEGEYFLAVFVWLRNDKGEYLIQKRAPWKKMSPNMWESAASGAAQTGDTSIGAAVRELREETGIELELPKSELLFSSVLDGCFHDVWLVRQNVQSDQIILQQEEVADWRWATEADIRSMVKNGEFSHFACLDTIFSMADSCLSIRGAGVSDAEELLDLQKKVFADIYRRYQDHETSPVNQTMERFLKRFEKGDYYKIIYDEQLAGSVFVYEKEPGCMVLHILNIFEKHQNKGLAQEVMRRLEGMYPQAECWELETILQEARNCHVYEKLGYTRTGEQRKINDRMTLVGYRKSENINRVKFWKDR